MKYYPILRHILLAMELITAIVALIYFFKLRNSYWKWFSIYLIFICIQECFWFYNDTLFYISKTNYYAFFGIPIQYLFFFWLYALKSLQNKKLYIVFVSVFLASYIPIELYFSDVNIFYSLNLTIGTILITVLVILEFNKQIRTDDILKFKENKMFYINMGVILFYVGTYPFFAFYETLSKDEYIYIWNMYFLYFILSNCMMYLLFTISFLWGKHHLK